VSNPSGAQPALLHYENGEWRDVTTRVDTAATPSTAGQQFLALRHRQRLYYSWSGFLAPVNADNTSVFKQGSTVPAKFRLTGIDAAKADLVARRTTPARRRRQPRPRERGVSPASLLLRQLFRYDASAGQYVFNLGTKGMAAASTNCA
jgi:hypothetical protein